MTTQKAQLRYLSTHDGFCRVYYKAKNKDDKRLFCMQNDGSWVRPEFNLYVCSRDGEASHTVHLDIFDIPESPGSDMTDRELNEFLRKGR